MFGLGPAELLIILVVVLLVFGRRLPQLARSLGEAGKEFRKGVGEDDHEPPRDSGTTPGNPPGGTPPA